MVASLVIGGLGFARYQDHRPPRLEPPIEVAAARAAAELATSEERDVIPDDSAIDVPDEISGGPVLSLPDGRPDWVTPTDDLDGEVHLLKVMSEPCDTEAKCAMSLREFAVVRVREYADKHLGVCEAALKRINADWVGEHVLTDERFLVERPGDTDTLQLWGLIEIDPADRHEIAIWQQQTQWKDRSARVGVVALTTLCIFGLVHLAIGSKRK